MTISKRKLQSKKKSKSRIPNPGCLPVVSIFRSNKNLIATIFSPLERKTLGTFNTYSIKKGTKTEKSQTLAKQVAEFLQKQKILKIVFNRSGKIYHGRVKAFAEELRNLKVEI